MKEKDPDTATTMAQVLLQFADLIKTIKSSSDEQAKQAAATQAELLIRTMPENKFPPLISVFNPLGERDHPRPQLACEMWQNGYKLDRDTLTLEEITLLNTLQPGDYRVTKANGEVIPFGVSAERNNAGTIQTLRITFPSKGEDRHDHASLANYLREAQGATVPTVRQLEDQLAALKAELAAARAA